MSKYIDNCFNLEENVDINKFKSSSSFIHILSDKIKNSDIAQLDNIIQCLSQLDSFILSEENQKSIITLWNTLAQREMSLPLSKQEFDSNYKLLLQNTDETHKQNVIKYLCKQIQSFKEFNGKDYYTSLNQIKDFVEQHKIAFDVVAELQEKSVNANVFLDYIIEAKENFSILKLIVENSELNEYFTTLLPDVYVWRQTRQPANSTRITNYFHSDIVDILKNLTKDGRYRLDTFINDIKQQIPNATATNFNLYFDAYKILSNEKPLKVQLNPTQRTSIWNALASKPNTPEFLEIVIIQIAHGTNTIGTFNDEQIKYIAENIDYYASYGILLTNNISWNIPVLTRVLKYMTENKLGISLSIENVLPQFEQIKSKLGVTDTILLTQLNRWKKDKDKITKNNIQQILPNAQFFQFSKATKNNLTDYLNKTAIEALSEKVTTDHLYQLRQQQTQNYWLVVLNTFIDTDFIKSLPDNLTELGKRYLDDIAACRRAVPNANDIAYKLIEKLDRRKTAAHIKDIRDKYCNSQYNINAQLFLYFESWFESQGDLKQVANRVAHKIIEPIINDVNCLNKIISKSDYYADIINAAGYDATTLKTVIRNKVQKSTDNNLIAFAKKIGIEKERISFFG